MRQIDNYTDKEREVLALKGMTAPRTASERTYNDEERRAIAYQNEIAVRLNKAQHSPHPLDIPRPGNKPPHGPLFARQFPYPCITDGDTARTLCFMNLSGAYSGNVNAKQAMDDARELAKRYNHADKLAEALRGLLEKFVTVEAYPNPSKEISDKFIDLATSETLAREALAAYTAQH